MNNAYVRSYRDIAALPDSAHGYYFNNTSSRDQWTLFLRFYAAHGPLRQDVRIRKASKAIIAANVPHHCDITDTGNDNGLVTYTLYAGAIDTHLDFLKDLAKDLACPALRVKVGELPLAHGLSARFDGQPTLVPGVADHQPFFTGLTVRGIPKVSEKLLFDNAIGTKISLGERILLHALIGHLFCAQHYGTHYLGVRYKTTRWDHGIFTRLADVLTLEEITTYVQKALTSGLPWTINPMLQATAAHIDMARLTGLTRLHSQAAVHVPVDTAQLTSQPLPHSGAFSANRIHMCATA